MKILISRMLRAGALFVAFILRSRQQTALSIFSVRNECGSENHPSNCFLTSDGFEIPIFDGYRYNTKKGWSFFQSIVNLHHLKQLDVLDTQTTQFLTKAIGINTLGLSLEEIEDVSKKQITRHPELFFKDVFDIEGNSIPKLSDRDIFRRIEFFRKEYAHKMKFFRHLGLMSLERPLRILEIGYETGGYSLFGFEKLGFEVFGLDNGYNGIVPATGLPTYLKHKIESSVIFETGDISKKTLFPDDFFDLIYSASVLEHIKDIDSTFAEMRRILKPNGLMLHNFHPYYCLNGGHGLGTGDSPWAHVLMSPSDHLDYIARLRPFEAATSREWVANALNRENTPRSIKKKLIRNNFEINFSKCVNGNNRKIENLSIDKIKRAFTVNASIELEDLYTISCSFAARKSS